MNEFRITKSNIRITIKPNRIIIIEKSKTNEHIEKVQKEHA
jgi:hypothetical protein